MAVGSFLGQEILKQPVRINNTDFKLQTGSRYLVGGYGVTLDSDLIVTASTSLDTGSLTANTLYYVYVVVIGGVASVKLSTNSSAPTGYLAYKNIGYVYVDGSSYLLPWQGTMTSLTYTQVNALTGNQGLGSFTAGDVQWLQTKDGLLHYKGKLTVGGGAGVSAVEARIPYPAGLIAADTTKIPSIQMAGVLNNSGQQTASNSVLVSPSLGYFNIGYYTSGASNSLVASNGSAMFSNGAQISFNFTVPIQGFPSTSQWLSNIAGS